MIEWLLGGTQKLRLPTEDEALPGRTSAIQITSPHAVLGTSLMPPHPEQTSIVYFGMGCFWGAEKMFWGVPGVHVTAVGYGAGITPNPTYEEVCTGRTGHNELVKVVYFPAKVSFERLLQVFWESHNPCEGMRQGNDIGTQYRSGIYTTSKEQYQAAIVSKDCYDKALSDQGFSTSTTEVLEQIQFYYAEDYHQQYLNKNPGGYCPNHTCSATGLPEFPDSHVLSQD